MPKIKWNLAVCLLFALAGTVITRPDSCAEASENEIEVGPSLVNHRERRGFGHRVYPSESPKHIYPFMVVMYQWVSEEWFPKCHGFIIDPYTIATSQQCAHFVFKDPLIMVVAGAHDLDDNREITRQLRRVCKVDLFNQNPPNKPGTGNEDFIGLFHIHEPWKFNEYVTYEPLPPRGTVPIEIDAGSCVFPYWHNELDRGMHGKLQHNLIPVRKTCPHNTPKNIVCTNDGKLPCRSSGAPLICTHNSREFALAVHVNPLAQACDDHNTPKFAVFPGQEQWILTQRTAAVQLCRPTFQPVVTPHKI